MVGRTRRRQRREEAEEAEEAPAQFPFSSSALWQLRKMVGNFRLEGVQVAEAVAAASENGRIARLEGRLNPHSSRDSSSSLCLCA